MGLRWQQRDGVHTQGASELEELVDGEPLLARLDVGEGRAAHPAGGGEGLLRQVPLASEPAERLADLPILGLKFRHDHSVTAG